MISTGKPNPGRSRTGDRMSAKGVPRNGDTTATGVTGSLVEETRPNSGGAGTTGVNWQQHVSHRS